jgi:predicted small lipoprotein YifL
MKKLLSIVALLSMLALASCNKETPVEGTNPEVTPVEDSTGTEVTPTEEVTPEMSSEEAST